MVKELDRRRWYNNRLVILGVITLAFFAVFGVTALMSQYRNIDVKGSLSLHDTTFGIEGSSCAGNGGYSDISSSAQVTVSDGAGKILAVSDLSDGIVDGGNNCSFAFTVKNLPYSDVYQFEVSHRGKLVYSHQQLVDKQYTVAMTLGE